MDVPTLTIVQEQGASYRVPIRGTLVLGRDPANEVALDDGYLSRRHCAVVCRNGRVVVKDMESYNGTYVNGQRIHEECYLLPGDVLKVGRTRLFVDFGEVQAQSANLKIYTPNLVEKNGVQPISTDRRPEVRGPYVGITRPAINSEVIQTGSRHTTGESTFGPQTRTQRRISPEDKTPIPPAAVEESAVVRGTHAERERAGMRVLAQITRVLSNIQDAHEFLDHVLGRILSVIPAERGCIMRLSPDGRSLYPECARSALPRRSHAEALRLGVSHTMARKVVTERVSVLVNDATIDQRFKHASSIQDLQVRSILCAPLWLGEEISGLIYLDHMMHAYAFSEADRDLLMAAANVGALGLERAMKVKPPKRSP
ncbi:MAG: FHA domain-containing protein [Planctomycetes bacterium]|nr:FHA domain-containing protein [Planctomycetota bacterium]